MNSLIREVGCLTFDSMVQGHLKVGKPVLTHGEYELERSLYWYNILHLGGHD